MTELEDVPVRLCCGQPHWGVQCPDGKVMCCLCFSRFGPSDLYIDENGITWDVCRECQERERVIMEEK